MSDAVRDETGAAGERRGRSDKVHVGVRRSPTGSHDFTATGGRRTATGGCRTATQLKRGPAERLRVPAEQLVLLPSGRVLSESDLLSQLPTQDESVRLIQRPQHPPSAAPTRDPAPQMIEAELTAVLDPDPESFTPSPTSPLCLGMQSLLEEITASPGLMESLLSGPYVSSLLSCFSQNPDLATQMLLSHPLFSGNPQLQQQMRQQIPLFLQQLQSPELLSTMLNPKAMEALLLIHQGLQTLAAEAPALIPTAGVSDAPERAPDSVLNSESGSVPRVATVTEQQEQFVQQMLQALADTNAGVHVDEAEFHDELEHLSSMGFRDRKANLQVLISTGGDLTTAIQHLLSL